MTYSNASKWADEHISKDNFECFDDWLNYATVDSVGGLTTESLLEEPEYIDLMHSYWIDEVGSECRGEIEDTDQVLVSKDTLDRFAESSGSRIIYTEQPIQFNRPVSQVKVVQPVQLPPTGRAPEITRFILSTEQARRLTFRERVGGFFRRLIRR